MSLGWEGVTKEEDANVRGADEVLINTLVVALVALCTADGLFADLD